MNGVPGRAARIVIDIILEERFLNTMLEENYLCFFLYFGLSMVFVHKESIYVYFVYSYYTCKWTEAGSLLMVFVHKKVQRVHILFILFISISILIQVFTRWGD